MKRFSVKRLWQAGYASFFLTMTVLVCVALLFGVNQLTRKRIADNALKAENRAIALLFRPETAPDASTAASGSVGASLPDAAAPADTAAPAPAPADEPDFSNLPWVECSHRFVKKYRLFSFRGEPAALLSLLASGYGGPIHLMALFKIDGELISATVVDHSETDGIGSMITRPSYFRPFYGRGAGDPFPVTKHQLPPADADAVSGATVSFTGVAKGLAQGSSFVRGLSASAGAPSQPLADGGRHEF